MDQFIKRAKSFAWRLGMVTLVFVLEWVSGNIGLLELSPQVTVVLGLMAGELSKYLNSKAV
jgi:hypothetical protein